MRNVAIASARCRVYVLATPDAVRSRLGPEGPSDLFHGDHPGQGTGLVKHHQGTEPAQIRIAKQGVEAGGGSDRKTGIPFDQGGDWCVRAFNLGNCPGAPSR